MAYIPLKKLYYENPQIYKDTYESRYSYESTVHLDFEINEVPAFFCQSSDVISKMYDILRLNEQVLAYTMQLPMEAGIQYQNQCLIGEIVTSNQIEGVHSTRKEIGEVLQSLEKQTERKGKKRRFTAIVSKYQKLQHGELIVLMTCQDVRDLYNELLLDEVIQENPDNKPDGEIFRKDMTEIQSVTGKSVHHGAYPERAIIEKMSQALSFLQNPSIEILYRACIFHYLIEYIHPFYDGNGRLGRFILSDYLAQNLNPLVAYRISQTILTNRSAYYDAFTACNDPRNKGDLTPFLLMLLEMIRQSMRNLKDSLKQKWLQLQQYCNLIAALPHGVESGMPELYEFLIMASLFTDIGISCTDLQRLTGFGESKVRDRLSQIPENLLCISKEGRKKFYKINTRVLDEKIHQN